MPDTTADDPHTPEHESHRSFLKQLLNHTVAICGTYVTTTDPARTEGAYAFSGCVVARDDHWYVLTAGHAIEKHIEGCNSPAIIITGRVLADFFGADAQHAHPIPFDAADRVLHFVNIDGGLDYAAFRLTDNEAALLKANGINAMPFRDTPLNVEDYEHFFVVGFPDEITKPLPTHTQAGVGLRPDLLPLTPVLDSPKANGRLVFRIKDKGTLESIVGLSGGPVFGCRANDGYVEVSLLAIQSEWNKVDTTYACAINDIYIDLQSHLSKTTE